MFFTKKKGNTASAKDENHTEAKDAQCTADDVKKETGQERKKYFGIDPVTSARIQLFKLLSGRR